jgi:hypothetical protein
VLRFALVIAPIAFATLARADRVEPAAPPPLPPGLQLRRPPQPPPAEVGELAKQLVGAYACKGVQLATDGSSSPLVAKLAVKLALDGAWIESSLVETKAGGIKLDDYRTYDGVAKQWTRIQLASTTGHAISTSLGERGGMWTWEGTSTSPHDTLQLRDYEQLGDRQIKLSGEAMLGGAWQKLYDVTCIR